jgi:hypothetical protein
MLQHVFISYRHESPEHARAVRRFAELLRQAAIPVALDQFHLEEHPGGPDLGWPKWCEDCANQSACVLIIGSEGWFSAYETTASPGLGLGAATEAGLFRQALWDEQGNNTRIRLAFLHNLSTQLIPVRLRAWHQFRPFETDDQLNQLIRWVADCLGIGNIELPTVRWPEPIEFRPNLADRLKEWPAIEELLAGRARERILLFEGPSGLGKSALVRQAAVYARTLGVLVVQLGLERGWVGCRGHPRAIRSRFGPEPPKLFSGGGEQNAFVAQGYAQLAATRSGHFRHLRGLCRESDRRGLDEPAISNRSGNGPGTCRDRRGAAGS